MSDLPASIVTRRIDIATVLGICAAAGFVLYGIALSGTPGAFIDPAALFIVLGGTFAITMACFSLQETIRAQRLLVKTVIYKHYQPAAAAELMLDLAARARRGSLLALQNIIASGKAEGYLAKGLSMVIDGVPVERIEHLLRQDMHSLAERHSRGVAVFRKSAEIAPAMGLIGTLIGLVQMLSALSDPTSIGPAMAIALLTTFYGAVLSYMVFTPLASKLERNTNEELLVNQIYLEGIISIAKQENPRQLETVMNTILPPTKRIRYFA